MPTRAHAHHLRKHRVSDINRGYLLTTVTRNRSPVFRDFQLARLAIHQLRHCDETGHSTTLAFALATAANGGTIGFVAKSQEEADSLSEITG